MKAFAELYAALDETTKTSEKTDALVRYFSAAPPEDAAWAIYFLIGRKPKQVVPAKLIRAWAGELAGIPDWLFQESYDAVGDSAETIALLLPDAVKTVDIPLHILVEEWLLPLRLMNPEAQKQRLIEAWSLMDRPQRFVWNKLITGGFRVGVSQQLVTRSLAKVGGIDPASVSHRLMGDWEPTPRLLTRLFARDEADADISRPYPFCLAHAIDAEPASLGDPSEWHAEWKWDGIRSQLIRRGGQTFLWSRGEELVTDRYPEVVAVGSYLPDGTVIDGELLPWIEGRVQPFTQLQRRIGRKTLTKKILTDVPVIMMAYDLLEHQGIDIRTEPLETRRRLLVEIVNQTGWDGRVMISELVEASTWEGLAKARETSRDRAVEGLMLKRKNSLYRVGRVRGDWWKWKIQPLTIDAVLIAAQRGSGKRAGLYTDYTFGVWDGDKLVTIAKAYSGLTDAEIAKVDAFVRSHTLDKFGPVRSVIPELVFEIAFEAINKSTRHKAGLAVRFPRIVRQRHDKTAKEADTLDFLKSLLTDL